ncbi:MAG: DUF5067 domain-containing protein [Oscillospiraceae bacterium]|nr:DUF5067 domain-containing protein [Oscillospiraceae bacterium]MBQ5749537.1 DUF5067 domain-containing protein [Oscillospiraceae bacterium]
MRKWKIALTVLLVVLFALFALASGSESTDNQGSSSAAVSAEAQDNTNLGDYNVVIDSCRLAQDYEGKPVVIVKYIFTNVEDDNASAFYIALDENVYQNGVGLTESYFVTDSANYNSDNQMKEIKKGATLEVECAYELNDTTTDIEVEVTETFSFDDEIVTKTFSIAG